MFSHDCNRCLIRASTRIPVKCLLVPDRLVHPVCSWPKTFYATVVYKRFRNKIVFKLKRYFSEVTSEKGSFLKIFFTAGPFKNNKHRKKACQPPINPTSTMKTFLFLRGLSSYSVKNRLICSSVIFHCSSKFSLASDWSMIFSGRKAYWTNS